MFDEFAEFVKKEYNEDLNSIMNIENKLINVKDKKENEEVEKLADDLGNLDLK
jgi:hypothetical protein